MSRRRVIGSYLSPYVRKVLVSLGEKGLDYEIDPIVPYFGNDEFTRLSPLREIPVLLDGDLTISDSTVILEYLEDRYPEPALRPATAEDRARCRWLEEYADVRMGEVFVWKLFFHRVIAPNLWGRKPDDAAIRSALEEEIPAILDYLEGRLPVEGWLFGALSTADVSIAAVFRNAFLAGFRLDASRWPRTARFVETLHAHPSFERLRRFEDLSLRTPPPKHRTVLRDAGAPISEETVGTDSPRPA